MLVSDATTTVEELSALREVLAARIDDPLTVPRDLAALSRQFRDVCKELREAEALVREEVALQDVDAISDEAPYSPEAY